MTQIGSTEPDKKATTKEDNKAGRAEKAGETQEKSSTSAKQKDAKSDLNNAGVPKAVYLLGIPVTLLLAVVVQYVYHNFYLLPKMERTIWKPEVTYGNINTNVWAPLTPSDVFSLRARHPQSPKFGLGWYEKGDNPKVVSSVRQTDSYSWEISDGLTFGIQTIKEGNRTASIKYVTNGQSFTVRLTLKNLEGDRAEPQGVFFYLQTDREISVGSSFESVLKGSDSIIGNFSLKADFWGDELAFHTYRSAGFNDTEAEEVILRNGSLTTNNGNTVVVYLDTHREVEMEISFSSNKASVYPTEEFFKELNARTVAFNRNFNETYKLAQKNMPEFYQSMGKGALSNLLSSKTYISGTFAATGALNKQFSYGPVQLLCFVHTRSSNKVSLEEQLVPLQFLLLTDKEACLEIIASWFSLANEHGWIPSSIDLTGHSIDFSSKSVSPHIFYIVHQLVTDQEFFDAHSAFFASLYPRLEKYATILVKQLSTSKDGAYGFKVKTDHSPFFDAQRVIKPEERHVDAQVWMAFTLKTIKLLAEKYGHSEEGKLLASAYATLDKNTQWSELFWSKKHKAFVDVNSIVQVKDGKRIVREEFSGVESTHTLLPFALNLLPDNEEYTKNILAGLADSDKWSSNYGISLSWLKNKNESSEETSPVNVPISFWILARIYQLAKISGPLQSDARILYSVHRNNLITWVAREYKRTGMMWEQYSSRNGEGRGHEQSIWTALVLPMMAEIYA